MIELKIYTDLISASLSFIRSICDDDNAYPLDLYFCAVPSEASRPAAGGAGVVDPGILITASTCDEDFDGYALRIAFDAELKELNFIVGVKGDEESFHCPLKALDKPESLLAIKKFLNEKLYSKLTASGASLDALVIRHLELLLNYLKPSLTPLIPILETRELLKDSEIKSQVDPILSETSGISYLHLKNIETSLAMLNLFSLLTPEYANLILNHENPLCLANALIGLHFYEAELMSAIPDLIDHIINQKYPDDALELLKLLHEKKILTKKIIETIFKEADFPTGYIKYLIQTLISKRDKNEELDLEDIMHDFSELATGEELSDLALRILYAIPTLYCSNLLNLENVILVLENPDIDKAEELAAAQRALETPTATPKENPVSMPSTAVVEGSRLPAPVFFKPTLESGAREAAVSSGGAGRRGDPSFAPAALDSMPAEKNKLETRYNISDLLKALNAGLPYKACG